MKVKDIMTRDARTVSSTATLRDAAFAMQDVDCGVVPVVDIEDSVIALLTDRDICLALAERDASPSSITVREVASGRVYAAHPDDDIEVALASMRSHLVRRLPVIDGFGRLHGILSMNDVLLAAREGARPGFGVTFPEVVETLQTICSHGKQHNVIPI